MVQGRITGLSVISSGHTGEVTVSLYPEPSRWQGHCVPKAPEVRWRRAYREMSQDSRTLAL